MNADDVISIGVLAARAGVSVSAIRYYEEKGLLQPSRNSGGQRRFIRADIRRLSFILIAQQIGCSIAEIRGHLAGLPHERTPTQADWSRISTAMRGKLNERIECLTSTRDLLDGCIGCGCLSLQKCALYNPQDRAAVRGSGPRYLMGDKAA